MIDVDSGKFALLPSLALLIVAISIGCNLPATQQNISEALNGKSIQVATSFTR